MTALNVPLVNLDRSNELWDDDFLSTTIPSLALVQKGDQLQSIQSWPKYETHPEDSFARNGFCRFLYSGNHTPEFVGRGCEITLDHQPVREPKDAGALKVGKDVLAENLPFYAEILVKTGLLDLVIEHIGHFRYPRNLMHLKNDQQTNTLIWHRDAYKHSGQQVGPNPSPLKLAVYLTDVDKDTGATRIQPRFKDRDFNNRYIDTLLAYLLQPTSKSPTLRAGDAFLFDGKLMHSRPKQTREPFREVLIYSIVRNPSSETKITGLLQEVISIDPSFQGQFQAATTPEPVELAS